MIERLQILLIISFFASSTSIAAEMQTSLQLRIFPELTEQKISDICVIDSNQAVAVGEETIFQWNGTSWQQLTPPFPLDRIYPDYLKAFSLKNVWLFVHLKENYYRSLIYHFDGATWNYIPSPQPYDLTSAAFIDSTSFFATGQYGNLIYCDGKTATNLPNPGGRSALFAAYFNPSHFLLWTKEDNSASQNLYRLNEYDHGTWQPRDTVSTKALICNSLFLSPDSGYFTNQDKSLFKFARSQFTFIKSFLSLPSGPYQDGMLYYRSEDAVLCSYNVFTQDKELIAVVPLECSAFPLGKNEFLLLGNDRNVYYLGKRNIGKPYKKQRLTFKSYNISNSPSNHSSVSSYRNKNDDIDLYFTNIYDKNSFFVFTFDSSSVGIVLQDTLQNRGLFGLDKLKYPEDSLDHGCFFSDIDNDGDMDAVIASIRGPSLLYENVGDDRFEDISNEMHFDLSGRIGSIWWSDLNEDGYLDIVAGDYCGAIHILLNKGQFRFQDVTQKTGIPGTLRNRFVAVTDVDNDGDHDLFLFNNSEPIRYFENQGIQDSTKLPLFVDDSNRSPQLTTRFDFFAQSMAFGDYDNDGDLDLFLANRRSPLKLFQNDGHGCFGDVSAETGFNQNVLAFGANWGDLDQDGYLDLFLTTLGKNYILWNDHGRHFEMDSTSLPANDLASSTGSILQDLDADGDLDIAVARAEISNSRIYRNKLEHSDCIKLQLRGTQSNHYGIGARIWLYESGHVDDARYLKGYRQMTTNTGYSSSCLPEVYFGVDPEQTYDVVAILPNGTRLTELEIGANSKPCILAEKASLQWQIDKTLAYIKNFIYRDQHRQRALRFLLFVLIVLSFNITIYLRKYWLIFPLLFLTAVLLVVYIFATILIPSPKMNWLWFLPGYVTIVAGILLYLLIQNYLKAQYKEERLPELYDSLRQFHHSKDGMKQISHLTFYLNNIQRTSRDEVMREKFANELKNFCAFTLVQMKRMLNEGKRLGMPLPPIRQIEKTIKRLKRAIPKTPLTAIYSVHTTKPLAFLLEKLKAEIKALRQSVEKNFVCDLLPILNDALSQYPQLTEVSLHNQLSHQSLQVIILAAELTDVFTNLFDNALEAMVDQKDKRLQITIESLAVEHVGIKIQDFGKGIPVDLHSVIFEEAFSTKDSSGLGLFHARKLVRHYGGDLQLLQSAPGQGAVFQIKLRIFEP